MTNHDPQANGPPPGRSVIGPPHFKDQPPAAQREAPASKAARAGKSFTLPIVQASPVNGDS